MRYWIITNMPGYLPEAEPYEVETEAAAQAAVLEELERTADCECQADSEAAYSRAEVEMAESWEDGVGCSVLLGGYVHEAVPAFEVHARWTPSPAVK